MNSILYYPSTANKSKIIQFTANINNNKDSILFICEYIAYIFPIIIAIRKIIKEKPIFLFFSLIFHPSHTNR